MFSRRLNTNEKETNTFARWSRSVKYFRSGNDVTHTFPISVIRNEDTKSLISIVLSGQPAVELLSRIAVNVAINSMTIKRTTVKNALIKNLKRSREKPLLFIFEVKDDKVVSQSSEFLCPWSEIHKIAPYLQNLFLYSTAPYSFPITCQKSGCPMVAFQLCSLENKKDKLRSKHGLFAHVILYTKSAYYRNGIKQKWITSLAVTLLQTLLSVLICFQTLEIKLHVIYDCRLLFDLELKRADPSSKKK